MAGLCTTFVFSYCKIWRFPPKDILKKINDIFHGDSGPRLQGGMVFKNVIGDDEYPYNVVELIFDRPVTSDFITEQISSVGVFDGDNIATFNGVEFIEYADVEYINYKWQTIQQMN